MKGFISVKIQGHTIFDTLVDCTYLYGSWRWGFTKVFTDMNFRSILRKKKSSFRDLIRFSCSPISHEVQASGKQVLKPGRPSTPKARKVEIPTNRVADLG